MRETQVKNGKWNTQMWKKCGKNCGGFESHALLHSFIPKGNCIINYPLFIPLIKHPFVYF